MDMVMQKCSVYVGRVFKLDVTKVKLKQFLFNSLTINTQMGKERKKERNH